MYTFQEDNLIHELNAKKPKRVLLQLPEGLKPKALDLAKLIQEKTSSEVIISGEPLWGACDVAVAEAKTLNCDMILIYGHTKFAETKFPILYFEATYEKDISHLLEKIKHSSSILIVASVQHIHQIKKAKEYFESKDIKVLIPKANGHAYYDGQVLGCEYNAIKPLAKNCNQILIIGNRFHALGLAMSVNTPVILLDPVNEEIEIINKDKIIKQRFAAIEKAKTANKIGIIIGTKLGQKFGSFESIKNKVKSLGKECAVISMGEITNDKLINLYDIDAFIELACPRIAIDAASMFKKPLLTAREFLVLSNEITWEELLEKGFL
jgi:2-(3-amino-3-carboxypropyl)histidine synthase